MLLVWNESGHGTVLFNFVHIAMGRVGEAPCNSVIQVVSSVTPVPCLWYLMGMLQVQVYKLQATHHAGRNRQSS